MYRVFICDDDSVFASGLEKRLTEMLRERGASFRIQLFSDPSKMLNALEQGEKCDLLFQDILFGREKGIRFARLLRERKQKIEVVFVTSSADYALEGYDVQPLHYLLKPVNDKQLSEALNRFFRRLTPRMLSLTTPHGVMRLPVTDALYFEIYNHTVTVHRADGGSQSWRSTLKELESELPSDCFVRTHRSYLVNLEHIAEIERGNVILTDGCSVPISKNAYANVRLALVNFDGRGHGAE